MTLLTLELAVGAAHYGRVSKVGSDYITLLVYGVFHCVIARSDIPALYQFGVMEKGGRRQEMMADTRQRSIDGWQPKGKGALAAAAAAGSGAGGDEQQLNKKQSAKLKKQQEKEERRQAFLRTQQQQQQQQQLNPVTPPTTAATTDDATDGDSSANAIDYAVRIGSLVRFVIVSTSHNDTFFSMSGSLTADGAALVPGDVVVPAEWAAKEEAEDEERRQAEEAEANSVEKLFAGEEEADDTVDADNTTAAAVVDGISTPGHVSKKELKERKRLDKANRVAAKAIRKQQHQRSHPISTTPVVNEKAAAMRQREAEEEAQELSKRREEDNQVNSVVTQVAFSHVDEHVIGGEEEMETEEDVKRRKRAREEAKSGKGEDREKKKKRKSTKSES